MTKVQSAPSAETIEQALAQHTLCAAFQVTAAAHPERPALRTLGAEREYTWGEYADEVQRIAGGLHALGVRAGDAVALMLAGCSEFHLIDTAAMHLGAAPFSIYFTNPVEQILPMIQNSEARVVFTQPQFVEIIEEVARQADTIEHIIVVEPGKVDLPAPQDDFDFEASWRAVGPDDIAGIVYTSGTTGEPKGVEWSHGALIDNMRGLHALAPVSPGGRMVSYLPMAHLAERFMTNYCTLAFGYSITTAPDPRQVGAALAASHPTRFFAVPRIYEKLGEGAKAIAGSDPALAEALKTGIEASLAAENDPSQVPVLEQAQAALAPVREKLGLESTEWRGAAAAPMRVDTHQVVHRARPAGGGDLGHVGDRDDDLQPADADQDGHGRQAAARRRGQAGRRRRAARPRPDLLALPQEPGADGAGLRGARPLAEDGRRRDASTRTATTRSSTARRRSSSTPRARTSRPRWSRTASRRSRRSSATRSRSATSART